MGTPEGAAISPLSKFWTKHFRSADPHYWDYFNLEDPDDRGYDALRRLMLLEMIEEREVISRGRQ